MKSVLFLLAAVAVLSASAVSVTEFGAKGDGVTDDTAAIQRAIDFIAERGGGKITFPYAPKGYRLAAPGQATWKGRTCRAQLCIPAQPGFHNCEEAIVFHDSTHLSMINHVVAQHNRCILSTTRENLFGHRKGLCNVIVGGIDYEHGQGNLSVRLSTVSPK